jgi:hypothetical protein
MSVLTCLCLLSKQTEDAQMIGTIPTQLGQLVLLSELDLGKTEF